MKTEESPVADLVDAVQWDFDPESDGLTPLISTDRYFRDFPWESSVNVTPAGKARELSAKARGEQPENAEKAEKAVKTAKVEKVEKPLSRRRRK